MVPGENVPREAWGRGGERPSRPGPKRDRKANLGSRRRRPIPADLVHPPSHTVAADCACVLCRARETRSVRLGDGGGSHGMETCCTVAEGAERPHAMPPLYVLEPHMPRGARGQQAYLSPAYAHIGCASAMFQWTG